MAKASSVQKNILRSRLIEKLSKKRKFLKSKIKDKKISLEERISFQNNWMRCLEIARPLDIEIDVS